MATDKHDAQGQGTQQAPERIEPDLTPAPGTPRPGAGAGAGKNEPGFDADSPDLADPQIDPPHPPRAPSGPAGSTEKRGSGDAYPPYEGAGEPKGRH
ncbi:DUF6021 family protein [Pseudomonas massiliensis]|uniref:DUF6021 family protein n=1 Tax=Pseudomonas massiliensis TaxID=522492 RepID=UPI000B269495|nr:DUF6021 family protein [Pseudomonas massiliensis]